VLYPNVQPALDGQMRSYVLWQEYVAPLIAIEFVSGSGKEERDCTPPLLHYAIYEVRKAKVRMYHLMDNTYQEAVANERGHYEIALLAVEIGIWYGAYQNVELPWLKWWDAEGNLLLTGEERAIQEQLKRQRLAEKIMTPEQLSSFGINPEDLV
jgi:hypothetical protein